MQDSTQAVPEACDRRGRIGRWLVVALMLLGIGLASFAIWFQWRQTRRCLAFYGSDVARQIQAAARVELWEPPAAPAGAAAGLESAARIDVSRAPGLVHLRRGLVEDANFDWQRAAGATTDWDAAFALYAAAGDAAPAAVLVIDFAPGGGSLGVAGSDRRVALGRIEKGIRAWLTALSLEK
jgi:hypothetical protein